MPPHRVGGSPESRHLALFNSRTSPDSARKTGRSKNKPGRLTSYAAIDYRLIQVLGFSAALVLVFTILVLGLVSGTAAGHVAVGSLLAPMLPAAILARRIGWSWPCAVLLPFMFPMFGYAVLNSAFVTLRDGGIRWRDIF